MTKGFRRHRLHLPANGWRFKKRRTGFIAVRYPHFAGGQKLFCNMIGALKLLVLVTNPVAVMRVVEQWPISDYLHDVEKFGALRRLRTPRVAKLADYWLVADTGLVANVP